MKQSTSDVAVFFTAHTVIIHFKLMHHKSLNLKLAPRCSDPLENATLS